VLQLVEDGCGADDERHPAGGDVLADDVGQAVLSDADLARPQALDLLLIYIGADHPVPEGCETGTGREPDVARSYYGNSTCEHSAAASSATRSCTRHGCCRRERDEHHRLVSPAVGHRAGPAGRAHVGAPNHPAYRTCLRDHFTLSRDDCSSY